MIFTFALLDQFAQENGTRRFTFAVSICSVRRSNGIRGMGPPSPVQHFTTRCST